MILNRKIVANKLLIGRNEWCQLPSLKIPAIKAKVDSGAKTSALHSFNVKTHTRRGQTYVSFDMHPMQGDQKTTLHCKAPVIDQRYIMSSNGQKEQRFVIPTLIVIGDRSWEIEMTLSDRDPLRYRMLLGREAIDNHALIHTGLSCHQQKISKVLLS